MRSQQVARVSTAPVDLLINNAGVMAPPARIPRRALDVATSARLWAQAERRTGLAKPAPVA